MTIADWLQRATAQLTDSGSQSARLDALLLVSDLFNQNTAWTLAHSDQALASDQLSTLDLALRRRLQGEPLAYIRGHQEFFGRTFMVAPEVLIPRPETEALLELLLALPRSAGDRLLDVGTGSGCIAIIAKLEAPELHVSAIDVSKEALEVARKNAAQLAANVEFHQQNLLTLAEAHDPYAFIVANVPYVDRNWERSRETDFEPALALYADDHGLELIKKLIAQSQTILLPGGFLLLEADPRQHQAICRWAKAHHLHLMAQQSFALSFKRTD